MGAPTWPPTPEEGYAITRKEYGEDARSVLDFATDQEAEDALLAHFLFRPPERELASGEAAGTPLDEVDRRLEAWLRMVSGRDLTLGVSDPASTDGLRVFLPRALPPPRALAEDALIYRVMGLVQVGLMQLSLLHQRSVLRELHRDWVLRSCTHALALRLVMRLWARDWPGIALDLAALAQVDKAWILRVATVVVPREGLPVGFRPLYSDLGRCLEPAPAGHPAAAAARAAVAAVDAVDSLAAAPLVLMGQAQALRQAFLRQRLGPPPLPYIAGIIRPEWWLHDLASEMHASEAWRAGPKPLALLRKAMRERTSSRLPTSIRKRMKAAPSESSALKQALTDAPVPVDEDGWRYDEWDVARGVYKVDHVRLREVGGHVGPLSRYTRLVTTNQGAITEIRRRFAALRLEERWVHGLPDGTELDLNRAVSAVADLRAGFTPRVDWYKRFQRARETVAILTLVDLSGSTQGRVVHLQEEALVLFSAGLEVLGYPYGFYGFNGNGPQDCRVHRLKGFDEVVDDDVRRRLANLQPGGATRLGAYLRHGTRQLARRREGRRVLLVLSDGRPHDSGDYTDKQGLADAAMAVREAGREGVQIHAISLDTQEHAEDALRTVFGPGRFLLLARAEELPQRLPELFAQLIR